ncbi:MAG: hypothetical protein ACP5E4_03785, partial [Candidatus Aenigmatarchaeota archaeon]
MIIVDANVAVEYRKIPLFFYKREIAFTAPVLSEIRRLAEEKKDGVLLDLVGGVRVIETGEKIADNSIIEAALTEKCPVATFDRILIGRLKKEGIDVLRSRGEIIGA